MEPLVGKVHELSYALKLQERRDNLELLHQSFLRLGLRNKLPQYPHLEEF